MDAGHEQLLSLAAALRREGRIEEAIAAYEQLLRVRPDLPDSWYNLGWLQRQAGQYEDALASYDEALRRGVGGAEEVRLNRAVILSDHLARPDEAEAELKAALKLKPDYLPAILNLGNLHEDRGREDEARLTYGRALEIAPDNALALGRLAGLSHSSELDQKLAERLFRAIRRQGISAAEQADIGFGLAGLLDAAGRFDEAFEAARAANEASRAASGARYDRSAVESFIDQLIATDPAQAAGKEDKAPVFILGMYRSGSTLTEQLLGGHGSVEPAGELDLIPRLVRGIGRYPQAIASPSAAQVEAWRNFYRSGASPFARGEALVTDKRPDNFLHIGFIKMLFPTAKIVHTRRNRLDNLLSLYFLHLDPEMAYALDLEDAAHWYAQYERLMERWKRLYPDDIFDLDYDELVQSPEPVLKRLLAFLGLDWTEGMLNHLGSDRPVRTASVWQVRQPLHARSSGRWMNYRKQLGELLKEEI